jgi:CRP-like cAMP-binding protein
LRRVRLQNERLALRHAEQRVLHYIETEGNGLSVELGQTRKDWAAELGLTHEALYRTLASMKRRRLLQVAGSRLTVIGRIAG